MGKVKFVWIGPTPGVQAVQVLTLETAWLGNRSYVVVDDTSAASPAVVVDPPRDIARVEALLDAHDAHLELVVETHRHADYASGGLQLSREYGAAYAVPPGAPEPAFDHERVVDGSAYACGSLSLRAVHTPGHTTHHMSYVL